MGKKIYLYILCFLILVTSTNYVSAQNTIEISKNTSDRLFNAIQVINSVNKHNTNKVLPLAKDINIITIKKGNNVFFSAKKDVIWKVIQPINAEGEEWTFKQIVNSISDEDKYQLVDENPSDLEEYGLKNPVYTLEFGNQKGKTKIFVGRETEDTSKIYTMFENCNKVYAIEALYMDFLSKPLKEIISPFAYIVDIKDVSNLTVKFDNKLVSCDIKAYQDPKKDKFVVNGKDVSDLKDNKGYNLFRCFYESIIGVCLSNIEIGAVPKGKSEITFAYKLKVAPYKMKVEFIPKNKDYYYVVKNGEYSNIIVAKKVFNAPDGLRNCYKKLMDRLKK